MITGNKHNIINVDALHKYHTGVNTPNISEELINENVTSFRVGTSNVNGVDLTNQMEQSLVTLDNINGNNNPLIAAKIVELKINGGVESKNIKVCYNTNPVSENQIYLVMYDVGDQIIVEILNFLESEAPMFIFKPE